MQQPGLILVPEAPRATSSDDELAGAVDNGIKRGTKVAIPFPNEATLLRLATTIVLEVSE